MRLIDADALPSVKFHALPYTHITPSDVNAESYKRGWNDAIDAIVDCAPTIDAVPVVRCRECRWWDEIENSTIGYCHACKHGYCSSHWEISIRRKYKGDFFCADGERSGGDGDG